MPKELTPEGRDLIMDLCQQAHPAEVLAEGRDLIMDLCQQAHPAEVLAVVRDYCHQQVVNCKHSKSMLAISREWSRAKIYIGKAIGEIEQ